MAQRVTRQYEMVFITYAPLTNAEAGRFLDVADAFVLLERTPIGAHHYRFVATTNANLDEFLSLVNTLAAPKVCTAVTINTHPVTHDR